MLDSHRAMAVAMGSLPLDFMACERKVQHKSLTRFVHFLKYKVGSTCLQPKTHTIGDFDFNTKKSIKMARNKPKTQQHYTETYKMLMIDNICEAYSL